ncbi:hypothetical protein DQ04_05471080 [Trypanosoma grayi]|uniref:hypothetical protein n=1 Tax=Trypanosoma grayi TaxID=71804 RepID=UPI0004F42694|nr:hypothetical protein DQ04_05471080 [Trypanosoma grayi]KEG09294.1 hypothetical protein DQ04_05471080 [Trypanosoma grayi]
MGERETEKKEEGESIFRWRWRKRGREGPWLFDWHQGNNRTCVQTNTNSSRSARTHAEQPLPSAFPPPGFPSLTVALDADAEKAVISSGEAVCLAPVMDGSPLTGSFFPPWTHGRKEQKPGRHSLLPPLAAVRGSHFFRFAAYAATFGTNPMPLGNSLNASPEFSFASSTVILDYKTHFDA